MEPTPANPAPLQFDTAIPQAAGRDTAATGGVTCAGCQRTLEREYFDVNGTSVCGDCRDTIERHADTPRELSVLARGALAGFVAAVLGAILYYAVIVLTKAPIALVAIAIGYMVGYGIRMGTRGRGARRFQILAVVLTYWSVGLGYAPLFYQAWSGADARKPAAVAADVTVTPDVAPKFEGTISDGNAREAPLRRVSVVLVLLVVVATFVLPVLIVFWSLPWGILTAAIIAFGMRQAWQMTGAPVLQISGPYRIGPG